MFTGIITDIGTIRQAEQRGDLRLVIGSAYDMESVAIGASIACSGACLTVVEKGADWFAVDLSAETVARTAPGLWVEGGRLNLERALKVGDELGGHIVTGHVDGVGHLVSATSEGDSTRLVIAAPSTLAAALAAKGSITLDGISLTVNNVEDQADGSVHFGLNIIPHTAAETTLDALPQGRAFNLEIDVLARYLDRMMSLRTRTM
ncbi:MAG: riboflavin synthase [Pseudomonadota bacterium]|uniref:Riboflavin synthase n=1 Tax=Sphingobium xenophagum TaxID=121428 RepID=A0A249MQR3_SPHXE|nr:MULTISPECIES: riboflavin synthase [Sphingobium]ASY43693.1 riboflavin synthase [Sphingobium xenophagum]ODT01425.1 MAG: riboflavin synthase subunit alpha [Erythrobacter sp. SCN 62-14]OUC55671.1 riboflavin synthase [Sphingobium sp. GW456-12-10-14-TSB1]QWT13175.1 riboflavin synthase [Sphingobium xenophagum]|tara:strand:+ start:1970 stop:2584 length:615 start_codon:yes stop_codon:yes gene_type:complete